MPVVYRVHCYVSKQMKQKDGDVEKGQRQVSVSSVPWSKIIVVVLAMGVLVAACSIAWVFQDWQTSLQVLAILVVVYVVAFYWRWIWVALRTVKRDFS